MKLVTLLLTLSSQLVFSQGRPPAPAGPRFTPRPDIIYQRKGERALVSCDGVWVNGKKERIFSVTIKPNLGSAVTHSMDSRTLEKELVCNHGFSIDEIQEFRDVLCTTQTAFELNAADNITYKKVMEASIEVARARYLDVEKRTQDQRDVESMVRRRDPDTGDGPAERPRKNEGAPGHLRN